LVSKKINNLKGKKILITAGPTWVAIDPVRVISNIATGSTGKLIARLLRAKGAEVTLLLGSGQHEEIKGVRIKNFRYFEELRSSLRKEIRNGRFDCIIHNAAVSDFFVAKTKKEKLSSGKGGFVIKLKKAPKIIDEIRQKHPEALLVMFKLEAGVSDKELIKRALIAQKKSSADMVVANKFDGTKLRSFIYNHKGLLARAQSRAGLAKNLISLLEGRL